MSAENEVYCMENDDKIAVLKNDLSSLQFGLPVRTEEGNKGDFGRCVVLGGSANYVGAPQFAAESAAEVIALLGEAAMRSGAGTTVLAVPDFLASALYPVVHYSAIFPLPSSGGGIAFDRETALRLSHRATSFAVGMGMADGDAGSWVRFLLDETDCRIVLDADGLKCESGTGGFKGRAVLTPHTGEFAAMTGLGAEEIKAHSARLCREYAAEHDCVLVLKGHESVISDGREVWINSTGNSRLSKGGSGDVLSGIIGGLLAWNVPPLLAARTGAYVLGRSAEFSRVNALAHLPDDIMHCIPLAFDELQGVMRL